ncbi:AMP-binding protein [Streptomyces alkaliphilus]|uniref:AMP-binding protein n=1 Tax=Streptomyces alkaliphilus TaxID=1472722 RepID=A0A7W3T9L8_9ACTN|nr:AMP-binding protein [Streptomyces alkaliphilus]MBB0242672.1 AMP-binding protein [Streptomyces alkaliphilus]
MTETAHVCRAYAVTGGLDTRALRAAWGETTDGLRSRTGLPIGRDGGPFGFTDLGGVADPGPRETAERLWADPLALSFPGTGGPAARLVLARPAGGGHLVMLAVNRAFPAACSPATLIEDLGAAYGVVAGGGSGDPSDVDLTWGPGLTGPLERFCSAEGVTPHEVLLAAYAELLGRHGGGEGPLVGMLAPAGARPVVRVDRSGRPSFRELVRRTAASTRTEAGPGTGPTGPTGEGEHRGRTFAEALFTVEEPTEPVLRLPGARVRRIRSEDAPSEANPILTVRGSAASSLTGRLEYRTTPLDTGAAAGLADQLRTLLGAALADPDAPVDTLDPETPGQTRAAVRDADLTGVGGWSGKPVHHHVRAMAHATPDAPAVVDGAGVLTYGELRARAERITRALHGLGAGEDSTVAIRLPNGPDQAAALLGVFDAGAHAVCLGTGHTGERGRTLLAGMRPRCLVLDAGPDDAPLLAWYRGELGGRVLDPGSPGDVPVDPGSPAPGPGGPDPTAVAGRWAYVAYTSGSTGRPKGIPQTHRTLAQFTEWFAGEFGIGPGARVAQWAAPGYDAGLVELFATLGSGATLYPVPDRIRAHPEKLAQWLATERITHFQTVPSFARKLLTAIGDGAGGRLPSLGHLLLAGEALTGDLARELREALPGARLINLYGATETILATWHEVGDPGPGTVPIGRPIPGRRVLVLDAHDRPCPAGVTGRIVVCGPHVTPGYVDGEAPGDAFRPLAGGTGAGEGTPGITSGPCYRSGDLGRRRWDGLLEFKGREDSRIKLLGSRLELTDVETVLAADASVVECAVAARTGPDGLVGRLVAYVVPRGVPDGEPAASPSVLRAGLRRWFGKALPPVSFVMLSDLPRNAGGKVDRRGLADLTPIRAGHHTARPSSTDTHPQT